MNTDPNDYEIDEFFDWLLPRLQMPKLKAVPRPPNPELMKLVSEDVEAHRLYRLKYGRYRESLALYAADDGSLQKGAAKITARGGEWELIRETLPDDPDWEILKFKWLLADLLPQMQGRQVAVKINDELHVLGEINRRGVAETEIPSGLDLSKATVQIDGGN
jgi:hypothetical protein